jgi:hypothetical protein
MAAQLPASQKGLDVAQFIDVNTGSMLEMEPSEFIEVT